MNKATQNRRILQFLDEHGSITPMEAIENLGVMRLAARIKELEAVGHRFDHEMVYGQGQYGGVHYMRYRRAV